MNRRLNKNRELKISDQPSAITIHDARYRIHDKDNTFFSSPPILGGVSEGRGGK
jgi:hypothetical protein